MNDISGNITVTDIIASKRGDPGLVDSVNGTYVWVHVAEACPKLYR